MDCARGHRLWKGIFRVGFRFAPGGLALILAALSPKSISGGGRGERFLERERQQFASGSLGQVSLKENWNLTGVWEFISEVEEECR